MLAKGNRSKAVTDACKKHGGFYLGSIGGPAARLAKDCITKVEVLEYPELGMEAVWKIEVRRLPGVHRRRRQGQRLLRGRVSTCLAVGQVVILLAVVGLSACADDAPAAPPTKSDFVVEANAICDEQSKLIGAVGAGLGESPSADAVDEFVKDTFVPAVRDEVGRIRALGFPPEDANKLNGVLFDIEGVLDDLSEDPGAVLDAGAGPFDDINRRLDEYGLTACGSGTESTGATTSTVTT